MTTAKKKSKKLAPARRAPKVRKTRAVGAQKTPQRVPTSTNTPFTTGANKDAEYRLFIQWVSTPLQEKDPSIRTQKEFAKHYNIDEGTLSDWKHRKGFWEAVQKQTKAWGRVRTPDLIAALYTQILSSRKPTGRDVKIWLEYIEDFMSKVRIETPDSELQQEQTKRITKALSGFREAQQKILTGLQNEKS